MQIKAIEPSLFDKKGDLIFDKLKAYLSENNVEFSKESYQLNWLGKSYAKVLANDANRTLLAPNTVHNVKPENADSKNLLIQGDNLAVLKHLRKAYRNSVKMIYIDPPYNTGSDGFVYNDDRKYSSEKIAEMTGEDPEIAQRIFDFINRNASSHSAWLTFMYPRLKVARELLKEDGVIFISIDDNEQAQLKMLCDEVFGEENFVAEFLVASNSSKNNAKLVSIQHEYCLCYAKVALNLREQWQIAKNNVDAFVSRANQLVARNLSSEEIHNELLELVKYPRFYDFDHYTYADEKGVYRKDNSGGVKNGNQVTEIIHPETQKICKKPNGGWRYKESEIQTMLDNGLFAFGIDETIVPQPKRYLQDYLTQVPKTTLFFDSQSSTKWLKKNKLPFDFPKAIEYIQYLLKICGTKNNDLILDFFAGSGTTAHAVMQLNAEDNGKRNYICVQLDEATDPKSEARKTGYHTIFEITKARIEKAAEKIKAENPKFNGDLGCKLFKLEPYSEGYGITPENPQQAIEQVELFANSDLDCTALDTTIYTILTTWAVNDGLPLTKKLQAITLKGDPKNYIAYIADNRLYLLNKDFHINHLADLLAKLDDMDNSLNIEKIIVFGHYFDSKTQREIEEAVNQYKTRKGVQLYWEARYE